MWLMSFWVIRHIVKIIGHQSGLTCRSGRSPENPRCRSTFSKCSRFSSGKWSSFVFRTVRQPFVRVLNAFEGCLLLMLWRTLCANIISNRIWHMFAIFCSSSTSSGLKACVLRKFLFEGRMKALQSVCSDEAYTEFAGPFCSKASANKLCSSCNRIPVKQPAFRAES